VELCKSERERERERERDDLLGWLPVKVSNRRGLRESEREAAGE